MDIDQRLDRLIERHEALTQTVELMAAENRERDQRLATENQERDRRMDEIMEAIARLLHIAEIHEHRIDRPEGS